MNKYTSIILLDNGSIRPQAVIQLRKLAAGLSELSGHPIEPVSLRHSDRISQDQLGGIPAETFTRFLHQQLTKEIKRFAVIPLFFTRNDALTSYLPKQIELLKDEFEELDVQIADEIYPLPDGEPGLVDILRHHLKILTNDLAGSEFSVVLVDHGSPSPQVTAVREDITRVMNQSSESPVIEQAVMERREGREYDFNGPLLQQYLTEKAESEVKSVIVLLMFFLPGKHAGDGGDIEEICAGVMEKTPGFNVRISQLIGENDVLLDILNQRLGTLLGSIKSH